MQIKPKIFSVIFLIVYILNLFYLIWFIGVDFVFAAQTTPPDVTYLPGVELREASCEGGVCEFPWIADYIEGIYRYGLAIVGMVAATILMYAGLLWVSAGGGQGRIEEAKQWIVASLTGLSVAMFSYILLNTVNPALTEKRSIKIEILKESPFSLDLGEFGDSYAHFLQIYGIDAVRGTVAYKKEMARLARLGISPEEADRAITSNFSELYSECSNGSIDCITNNSVGKFTYSQHLRGKALDDSQSNETLKFLDCSSYADMVLKKAGYVSPGNTTTAMFGKDSGNNTVKTFESFKELSVGSIVGYPPAGHRGGKYSSGHVWVKIRDDQYSNVSAGRGKNAAAHTQTWAQVKATMERYGLSGGYSVVARQ